MTYVNHVYQRDARVWLRLLQSPARPKPTDGLHDFATLPPRGRFNGNDHHENQAERRRRAREILCGH